MFDSSRSKIRVEARWRNRKQSTKIQSNHLLPRKTFRGRFTQRKTFQGQYSEERTSRLRKYLFLRKTKKVEISSFESLTLFKRSVEI